MDRRTKSKQIRKDNNLILLNPQGLKRDYTHTIIIALSTIVAAYIVSSRK